MKQYELVAKFNLHTRIVRKWLKCFKEEGESGLEDRSSCPHTFLNATPPEIVEKIITTRKEGKMTGNHIARELNILQRIVSHHLSKAILSRQKDIESKDEAPPRPYQHEDLG